MSDAHPALNLRQLRAFVEAADAGTMTAAAERLLVTQSAVSLAVGKLEAGFGTQLLVRSRSTGLVLTAAGRELLPRARALLAHADEVRDAAQAAGRALRGRLSVGCFRTVAPSLLPAVLEVLGDRHPDLELEFVEAPGPEIERALAEGRCEVAVLDVTHLAPGLEHEPLFALRPHVLLAPDHPLAEREALRLADVAPHPLVLLDVPPSGDYFRGLFAAAGLEPVIRHRASSIELVRSLVARGQGYGVLGSRPATSVSWEGRPLVERELLDDLQPVPFSLTWVAGTRRSARAQVFADACREVMAGRG